MVQSEKKENNVISKGKERNQKANTFDDLIERQKKTVIVLRKKIQQLKELIPAIIEMMIKKRFGIEVE